MERAFMKYLVLLFLVLPPGAVFAQDAETVSENIAIAIGKGDAQGLTAFLSERVDMELPGSEGIFSKTQAGVIIKKFFSKHPAGSFSTKHSGSSGEGARYTIGTYVSGGQQFRVYFLLKNSSGAYRINQLRFEPES